MTSKPHLVDSADPVPRGQKVLARCGVVVENAEPVFMWDEQSMGTELVVRIGTVCPNCWKDKRFVPGMRYVYGCQNREQAA